MSAKTKTVFCEITPCLVFSHEIVFIRNGYKHNNNECFSAAPPAQEANQSSVSPRLGGGEKEEEDPGEEGRLKSRKPANQIIKDHFSGLSL